MKKLLLFVLTISMTLSLFAIPMWDNPVPIRQSDQVEWNRCGASTADGCMIYVWSGTKRGDRDIYAQKVSATGALLWQQPLLVNNNLSRQINPVITRTTDNNFIIAWWDYPSTGDAIIKAQKITSNGQLLWQSNGVAVCNVEQTPVNCDIVADNINGAYIVWGDQRNPSYDIYGQHLDGYGNALWTVDGIPLANGPNDEAKCALSLGVDGSVILAYLEEIDLNDQLKVNKFSSIGQTAWNLPLNISTGYYNNKEAQMCSVTDSTFVITWNGRKSYEHYGSDIYAQRFDINGNLLWTNPIDVFNLSLEFLSTEQLLPRIISSGDNAVIIAWEDYRSDNSNPDIFVQKVSSSGQLLWNQGGNPICTESYSQHDIRLAADNNGGCYIVWDDSRNGNSTDIFAQHITASGNILWETQGKAICSAPSSQSAPMIKMINNNIFIGWLDERTGSPSIYYQVVNTSGNIALEANGKLIHQGLRGDFSYYDYITLGRTNGTAIIWTDYRKGQLGSNIYFQFLNPDGTTVFEDNGRPVAMFNGYDKYEFSAIATPDNKIAIVWCENTRIKAQLLDSNGDRLWGDYGMDITADTLSYPRFPKISYQDGALYIGWRQIEYVNTTDVTMQCCRVWGQKIVNNQKQWGDDGVIISEYETEDALFDATLEQIVGRYYVWTRWSMEPDTFGYVTIMTKLVNPDGSTAPGWLNAGISVSDYLNYDCLQYQPKAIVTDAGLFVAWLDFRGDFVKNIYGQLISPQGILLWNSSGLIISNDDHEANDLTVLGENTDITLFWSESNDASSSSIKIQKLTLGGVPLLGEFGASISVNQPNLIAGLPTIVEFDNGSMMVAWEHNYNDIYYQFVNHDGSVTNPNNGICLSTSIDIQQRPRLSAVGNDAYLFWADSDWIANDSRCGDEPTEGNSLYAQRFSTDVAIDDETISPALMSLEQNYPNPFNPTTNISFNLKGNTDASLTIYNQKGQKVRTLHNGLLDKGRHDFSWNGKDDNDKQVSSGVYIYKLASGNTTQTRKMVLLK